MTFFKNSGDRLGTFFAPSMDALFITPGNCRNVMFTIACLFLRLPWTQASTNSSKNPNQARAAIIKFGDGSLMPNSARTTKPRPCAQPGKSAVCPRHHHHALPIHGSGASGSRQSGKPLRTASPLSRNSGRSSHARHQPTWRCRQLKCRRRGVQ
jgi:hypothetical protein